MERNFTRDGKNTEKVRQRVGRAAREQKEQKEISVIIILFYSRPKAINYNSDAKAYVNIIFRVSVGSEYGRSNRRRRETIGSFEKCDVGDKRNQKQLVVVEENDSSLIEMIEKLLMENGCWTYYKTSGWASKI